MPLTGVRLRHGRDTGVGFPQPLSASGLNSTLHDPGARTMAKMNAKNANPTAARKYSTSECLGRFPTALW